MPMRISFELSDKDLAHLRKRMLASRKSGSALGEEEITRQARKLLTATDISGAPRFIRDRIQRLGKLIDMVEDADFDLSGADRKRVLQALSYFAEPHDVIPDSVPGIGFLDDAILAELVILETRHEIEAYRDFRIFLERERKTHRGVTRQDYLQARRKQLHQRMRRRRQRARRL